MPFVQRKLNASKWDLKPGQIPEFNEIHEAARANGFTFREPAIVQLLQDYGKDRVLDGIRGLIGRSNYSLDTLVGLIEGSINRERPKPPSYGDQAKNAPYGSNGASRQARLDDARSLQSLLAQAAAKPDPESQPQYRPHARAQSRYFTENQVLAWMQENGHANSEQDDGFLNWFVQAGVGQDAKPIYKLREDV